MLVKTNVFINYGKPNFTSPFFGLLRYIRQATSILYFFPLDGEQLAIQHCHSQHQDSLLNFALIPNSLLIS